MSLITNVDTLANLRREAQIGGVGSKAYFAFCDTMFESFPKIYEQAKAANAAIAETRTQSDTRSVFEKINAVTARLGIVICIAGAIAGEDSLSDDLNDFLTNQSIDEITDCLGPIPHYLKEALDGGDDFPSAFIAWALNTGKLGFIVQVDTPDMTRGFYSWGFYMSTWVYGKTFDAAVSKALEWVAGVRTKEQKGGV